MRLPQPPPGMQLLVADAEPHRTFEVMELVRTTCHNGRYVHWDELRRRTPPQGLTHDEWWLGLKWKRSSLYKQIPLVDVNDQSFVVAVPEQAQEVLHKITQRTSGSFDAPDQITNTETRDRYIVRNLIEEGINSSLIEGASTTRAEAKEMIHTERSPRSHGEQMVLNNYRAMHHIIENQKTQPLTPEVIFELHEIITRDTLENPDGAGRLRRSDERIDIIDQRDNQILHVPPPADQLVDRMNAMCRFANGETPPGFIHPVVRSILLHFWLAYDHPFKDGNGRTARALFYWCMLQNNYWLFQFVSISEFILRAPAKYGRAFLCTESDDNDLTYFLFHQLDVLKMATDKLYAYLDTKAQERQELEKRLRLGTRFNSRQLEVLANALRHPNANYTIKQQRGKYGVVYQTARTDLLELVDKGLLLQVKMGRTYHFTPVPDMELALERLQADS